MLYGQNIRTSPWMTLLFSFGAILLVFCIVLYPDQAFKASLQGLSVWWKLIFPALLPFLVLSEIMIAYGFAHGLGVLLDPVMRRVFGIPGVGGWALALGWTAGFPAGAEATATLRKMQVLQKHEANRLLALSHVSNPILIIVVIGVGFLQQPHAGLALAIFHWASAILTGFILYGISPRRSQPIAQSESATEGHDPLFATQEDGAEQHNSNLASPNSHAPKRRWQRILEAMEQAHQADGRTFGRLLGDAVSSAVQTLMMVGGYMMIFSIIAQIVQLLFPMHIAPYWVQGFLELHLGTYGISTADIASNLIQMAILSGILAWSGISAHLQIRSKTQSTDMSYLYFLLSRMLHCILAVLITLACWNPLQLLLGQIAPSFLPAWGAQDKNQQLDWFALMNHVNAWYVLPIVFISILAIIMLISGLMTFLRHRHRTLP
ncbi:nucleoside recognition domain-containing protein [Paenibacillus guangzhouensis]|uniref:nucleoside recognition domain-containing protein n=1 Tax=Paenibacillus guangzhouensis TaxID=1473112 RepID=UPI00126699E2|nr:nucleoside recognition domain-containing protein [Paenibacillus guangzhouensis]